MTKPLASDAAVQKATGRDWPSWFSWLDQAGARDHDHKAIVALLTTEVESGWWRQNIAGSYEQAVLGRGRHEMPDGFQATASKTIDAPLGAVWASVEGARTEWMPKGALVVSTAQPGKALRGQWRADAGREGRLDVMLYEKGPQKTLVQINVTKLADAAACDAEKTSWRDALRELKERLEA